MLEDDREKQELDGPNPTEIRLFDTGSGYLVFRVWLTYEPMCEKYVVEAHRLIGVAEVENWLHIRAALRAHGYDPDTTTYLPEYSREELPSQIDYID